MRFDIVTVFPEIFAGALEAGIIRRARQAGLVEIRTVNLRDFATSRHRSVDDRPYGGGEGMVLTPGPLFAAVEHCRGAEPAASSSVILLTPQGETWNQNLALQASRLGHVVLICGRYEGVDQRVIDTLVDKEISIGDYVLSGGEFAALVVVDTVIRLLPGALGNAESSVNESFSAGGLDYPQYTRPAEFRGMVVPDVLLSGDHARIREWRRAKALEKTRSRRPDLVPGDAGCVR
ncbi:MAG: tRNA (guanosine(37)-N1)-methyltransferase TrmD [Acidobacteria bacterium]|nr:tRNA (guanosine(37)-N1)-methyltransferase TrmD [Acidobacteriota bacterium]